MQDLQTLLHEIDGQKAALDALRPIREDRLHRILQKLRLEWNYHSNAMEGNSLTLVETRALIYFGLTAGGKPIRDHLEMRGHNEALKKLEQAAQGGVKITENLIRELHRTILVEFMPVVFRLENKRAYFLALDPSTEKNYTPLTIFTGQALKYSLDVAIRGARGESLDEGE